MCEVRAQKEQRIVRATLAQTAREDRFRQTDTTPRKADHSSHISRATTKKVPFAFGDQMLTGRDGTLLRSAGPEWYGYRGIIDTEASTWALAVGRPSKSAGCLTAQKRKKKKTGNIGAA